MNKTNHARAPCECGPRKPGECCTQNWIRCNVRLGFLHDVADSQGVDLFKVKDRHIDAHFEALRATAPKETT